MSHFPTSVASTQEFLDKLQASAPANVLDLKGSMQFGDEYKYVTIVLDPKAYPDGVEIIHITDVQYGHLCCKVDKFVEYRDWILDKPNRFVFFGGDMIDAAHALSVASPYENTVEPQAQVYRFVELAMPMRHRILGYVGGNHERRSSKTFGDLGHLIASLLRVPYSSGKQLVDIHYGEHKPFKNALFHGRGAAQTSGAKMMMLERFAQQGSAHCYWVGHLHDAFCKYWSREIHADGTIKMEKYAGVMSSSFLSFWGTYAEVAGMNANDLHMWKLNLTPNGKWGLVIR